MVVGILEVRLYMEGMESLKEKRKVIKSLLGRVKSRFNVAVAELEEQDEHTRATLGFSVCGADAKVLSGVLDHLLNYIYETVDAEVVDSHQECLNLGSLGR
ncbi:MAG: DUF503 domain-containing protein [Deltaproteobacteria bacterium]|jgi:uncharacterized protein YlxP (DUF503 family)|nr:DUF503 domain-containing protein [Deltaproteobacteria bacterium]